MTIRLYIVRHGETEENAAGILQGHIEGHLSERGVLQAQQLREEIKHSLHPDRIFSSDLKRTVDTAKILNEAFHLPITTSPLLRERDWGEYTGRKIVGLPQGAFPPSVETIAHMMERAGQFLQQLSEECQKSPEVHDILIVSHGVFSRCLLAAAARKSIHDIPILKNLEMRETLLPLNFKAAIPIATQNEVNDTTSCLSHGKES